MEIKYRNGAHGALSVQRHYLLMGDMRYHHTLWAQSPYGMCQRVVFYLRIRDIPGHSGDKAVFSRSPYPQMENMRSTGGSDGTVKLYDIYSGGELLRINAHPTIRGIMGR